MGEGWQLVVNIVGGVLMLAVIAFFLMWMIVWGREIKERDKPPYSSNEIDPPHDGNTYI